eukprot:4941449-Prymnesium_polylepis.1
MHSAGFPFCRTTGPLGSASGARSPAGTALRRRWRLRTPARGLATTWSPPPKGCTHPWTAPASLQKLSTPPAGGGGGCRAAPVAP